MLRLFIPMTGHQTVTRFSFCLLAYSTLAIAPIYAQSITHTPVFTFNGDTAYDDFGASVSGAGDVNGDGFADVIVGAPFDGNNGLRSGSARVLSGADGSILLFTFEGDSLEDNFGRSVSGAGDVNGDGFADLIVGAPGDDNTGSSSGSARVISGANGSILYTFNGDSAFDDFGTSVSGAGDVNGDGFADLIAGAPDDDNNGTDSGSARVFSGADGSILYTFNGDSRENYFGRSVSGAGDVNGDGFDDVIVGAPGDDNVGTDSGSARVFSGADGSILFTRNGESSRDLFGRSVSGAGDVDGDGFDDVIVGAPEDGNNGIRSGSARVFSGANASQIHKFDGDMTGDLFGTSVSGTGDVNGDGFADVIVGASENDFISGRSIGTARVFSGNDGSILYTFNGDSNGDLLGTSVSGAGDVNGDGVADFVVGAQQATQEGYARVFVSQATGPPFLLGDCNQDGVVNFLDIAPFIGFLTNSSFLEEADIDGSGEVTFVDIFPFIAILSS